MRPARGPFPDRAAHHAVDVRHRPIEHQQPRAVRPGNHLERFRAVGLMTSAGVLQAGPDHFSGDRIVVGNQIFMSGMAAGVQQDNGLRSMAVLPCILGRNPKTAAEKGNLRPEADRRQKTASSKQGNQTRRGHFFTAPVAAPPGFLNDLAGSLGSSSSKMRLAR